MAQLVVRHLEEVVKVGLRRRAARHGRSMEEEVRDILRNAVKDEVPSSEPLGRRLRAALAGIGLDEDIPELRGQEARPADLSLVILLDTNVLSAMMRKAETPSVERWLDAQPILSVWTTTITVFEVHFGLELLIPSRRRDLLDAAFTRAIDEVLGGRVLPFDRPAALAAGAIAAQRRRQGRPIEIRDLQIAGIAAARKATLATRNIRHFEGVGIALVDPWTDRD